MTRGSRARKPENFQRVERRSQRASYRGPAPQIVERLNLVIPGKSSAVYTIIAENYPDPSHAAQIQFIHGLPGSGRRALTYQSSDNFLFMYPLGPWANTLVTVWEGGDHEAMRIFLLRKDKVSLVFEAAAKGVPEIVWDGSVVLVNRGHLMKGNEIWPTKTEIYVWSKREQRYRLSETIPYIDRYSAVANIVRKAEGSE